MKRISSATAALFFSVVLLGCANMSEGGGWKTLFDSASPSLDQFAPVGNANWRVADGLLQANEGSGFQVTKASYGNFEMRVEFWADTDTNSGVFIRCANPSKISAA